MDDNVFNEYKKSRKLTQYIHEQLKSNNHFKNEKIMKLLMDDSKLNEESCGKSKIRIGPNYQCHIESYRKVN